MGLSASREELSNAVYDMLLEDVEDMGKKEDLKTLYCILIDMLRCIYTLETGELPTKSRVLEYYRNMSERSLYENVKVFS